MSQDEEAVRDFSAALKRTLLINIRTINTLLHRRNKRILHDRLNLAGIGEILVQLDREKLSAILAGERICTAAQLAEIGQTFRFTEIEMTELGVLRERSERPKSGSAPHLPAGSPEDQGLYMLNRWTSSMPLLPENLQMITDLTRDRTTPHTRRVARRATEPRLARWRGSVSVVKAVGPVDWREAPGQNIYSLTVQAADYPLALATRELHMEDTALQVQVKGAAATADAEQLIKLMPFSMVAANVSVITSDDRVVIPKRSSLVKNYKNEWNVGINETMHAPGNGHVETLFELAYRGLDEELGLASADVARLIVSWFGYCTDCCNFYVFASARVRRSAAEVEQLRTKKARDAREHTACSYPAATDGVLSSITAGSDPIDEPGGQWLHHAKLSAHLLWATLDELAASL